jgi:type I restriction enzyme M protein
LAAGCAPKPVVHTLREDLLAHYTGKPLIGNYAVYQHLMDYSATTLLDDLYLIAAEGWKASTYRVIETKKGKDGKPGKEVDKGWACDLVPKPLLVARYFAKEQTAITALEVELESLAAQLAELEEEHGGEEGLYAELDKVNKANVAARLKELGASATAKGAVRTRSVDPPGRPDNPDAEELAGLNAWLKLADQEAEAKKKLKKAEAELDQAAYAKYPTLTEAEVKVLVVEDKWLATLSGAIHGEMDRISQALTQRVKELAERYAHTLPQLDREVETLSNKVEAHLKKMDFAWN